MVAQLCANVCLSHLFVLFVHPLYSISPRTDNVNFYHLRSYWRSINFADFEDQVFALWNLEPYAKISVYLILLQMTKSATPANTTQLMACLVLSCFRSTGTHENKFYKNTSHNLHFNVSCSILNCISCINLSHINFSQVGLLILNFIYRILFILKIYVRAIQSLLAKGHNRY